MAAVDRPRGQAKTRTSNGRVGVVDIGSNTVRLVVYDTSTPIPVPVFNEKASCQLGRGLAESGHLSPEGIDCALRSLARFAGLAQAMGVERLELVATAAVREASDGASFVARIEYALGMPVQVLSGEEEARLAALGLLNGIPGADGVLADLGGGSLDLVELVRGSYGRSATLPLGHLRLMEVSGNRCDKAAAIAARELTRVPWLPEVRGRTLYAVGGSWRSLARIFIEQTKHPLHVVDNYTIQFREGLRIAEVIGGLTPRTLERVARVPRRRVATLAFASNTLAALIQTARPSQVTFSGFGMREGQLLKTLPQELRGHDALIAACAGAAKRVGLFQIDGEELMAWTDPLFPEETAAERRLRLAACHISDIGWSEHPDYRAEHAFLRVLRLPFAGLTHSDRVVLALTVLARYDGDPEAAEVKAVRTLLDDHMIERAHVKGLALRLAHTISGSAPGLLGRASVRIDGRALVLGFAKGSEVLLSETVARRFNALARAMGLEARS